MTTKSSAAVLAIPLNIRVHEGVEEFAQQRELDPQLFEFEMLHGATPDRLKQMLDRGYRVRDYLPYGREWYLYVCHRLAEYPPNIYRALADAVDDNCRPV